MAISLMRRLQESEPATKRLYLIVGTALSMMIIIGTWLTWFNPIDLRAGLAEDSELANISNEEGGGFSLWQSVKAGLRSLGGVILQPREYIVKPPQ